MSEVAHRAYRRLPGPARTLVAGLHGHRLRRWRYGRDTDALVRSALERERWSVDRWQSWIEARRTQVLERARQLVPHYRGLDDRPHQSWPLLDKEAIRIDPTALLASDVDRRRLYEEHTSGSTGTPLRLWWSRGTVRQWYALFEARARHWNAVSRHDPWALLGGQLVVAAGRRRPPFWVWNRGLNQLYLSSYHLAPSTAGAYADAIEARGVTHLIGYPSALATLARELTQNGRSVAGVEAVIGNAEPVLAGQRDAVTTAFGVDLVETYGMAELTAAAANCEAGASHLWPEVGTVEVLDGELVATGLLNGDMPLIRYRTGDRLAQPPNWDHACSCGRTLPTLGPIEGRTDDVVVTPDGRHLGRLDSIFKSDLPVVEAQIIQDEVNRLRVRVVPARPLDDDDRRRLAQRVCDHVGDMEVTVEPTDRIERSASGKFRSVVSLIGQQQR